MIKAEMEMTYRVANEPFLFLVTSHEGNSDDISIHERSLGASLYLDVIQAKDLIQKLQEAIIRIEAHKLSKGG